MANGRLERREEAIDLALGYILMLVQAGKRQAWTPSWLRTPGERQAGLPRRSDKSGLGVACACAVGRSETLLQSFNGCKRFRGFRRFRRFKRLGAGKRQAWTPIRSH